MTARRICGLAGLIALTVATVPAMAQQSAPPPAQAAPVAEPDPARLAAATTAAAALIPDGIYTRMMRDQFPALMDAMMIQIRGMRASDLGLEGEAALAFDKADDADPALGERMRIMTRVMADEMGPVFAIIEPKVRDGLAASFARRFSTGQLADMIAFFATPSGKAFADQFLLTFMDPEMMRGMMSAMPEMMKAMPTIMKKVESATAHLPPPPKPDGAEPAPPESDDPEGQLE